MPAFNKNFMSDIEIAEIASTNKKDLFKTYSLAARLCVLAPQEHNLSIYRVSGSTVGLADDRGMPIYTVSINDNETLKVKNWHQSMRERGKDRSIIESKNSNYVLDAVTETLTDTLKKALDVVNSTHEQAHRQTVSRMTPTYFNMVSANPSVSKRDFYEIVSKIRNGESIVDHPGAARFEDVYKTCSTDHDKMTKEIQNVEEFYTHEKWIVGVFASSPDTWCIGKGKFRWDSTTNRMHYVLKPDLKGYATLNRFCELHPDEGNSLKSSMTMVELYNEKNPSYHRKIGGSPALVAGSVLLPELGLSTYCSTHTPGIFNPQWAIYDVLPTTGGSEDQIEHDENPPVSAVFS